MNVMPFFALKCQVVAMAIQLKNVPLLAVDSFSYT